MEQTPQSFVEGLMKAPPTENLKNDASVTIPEMKEFLGKELAKTFRLSSDEIIGINAVAGSTLIGLVIANALQKQYGQEALKRFILSIGEKVLNTDRL